MSCHSSGRTRGARGRVRRAPPGRRRQDRLDRLLLRAAIPAARRCGRSRDDPPSGTSSAAGSRKTIRSNRSGSRAIRFVMAPAPNEVPTARVAPYVWATASRSRAKSANRYPVSGTLDNPCPRKSNRTLVPARNGVNGASSLRELVRPCANTVTGGPSPSTSTWSVASCVVMSGMRRETLLPFGRAYDVARRPMPCRRRSTADGRGRGEDRRCGAAGDTVPRAGDGRRRERHRARRDALRLSITSASAAGYPDPEAFIHACFAFLLARESKGSILRSFDVSQIETYFPEFEAEITR